MLNQPSQYSSGAIEKAFQIPSILPAGTTYVDMDRRTKDGTIRKHGHWSQNAKEKIDERILEQIGNPITKKARKTKLQVRVELNTVPGSALLDKLNRAGLRVYKRVGTFVIGEIDLSKVLELCELHEIVQVKLK